MSARTSRLLDQLRSPNRVRGITIGNDVMSVRNLSRDEVKDGLAGGAIVLVDVREPHEFAAGSIPGSVSMPLSRFDVSALPDDPRSIVFSCAAGVRSLRAVEFARAAGRNVDAHYAGGFKDWIEAGEQVA